MAESVKIESSGNHEFYLQRKQNVIVYCMLGTCVNCGIATGGTSRFTPDDRFLIGDGITAIDYSLCDDCYAMLTEEILKSIEEVLINIPK